MYQHTYSADPSGALDYTALHAKSNTPMYSRFAIALFDQHFLRHYPSVPVTGILLTD